MSGICGFVGEGNIEILRTMSNRLTHAKTDSKSYGLTKNPVFIWDMSQCGPMMENRSCI